MRTIFKIRYQEQLLEYLSTKNIFIEPDRTRESANYIPLGLVIDRLNYESHIEDIHIGINTTEIHSRYNLLFVSNLDEDFIKECEQDKVLEAFFKNMGFDLQICHQFVKLYGDEPPTQVCWVTTNDSMTYTPSCIACITTIIPRLFKDLWSKEVISANMDWLNVLSQKMSSPADMEDYIFKEVALIDINNLENNWRNERIKKAMEFSRRQFINKQQSLMKDIRIKQRSLLEQYNELTDQLNESIRILNLNTDVDSDDNYENLMDYLNSNRFIQISEFFNNTIFYDVVTTISLYNIDDYKRAIDNINSAIYNASYKFVISNDEVHKLFDEIFLDKKYKVHVAGSYELYCDDIFSIQMKHSNASALCKEHPNILPAPHLTRFGCSGDFAPQWNEALNDGNLIGALQSTVGLVQNINWADAIVVGQFVTDMFTYKCIEDADGNFFNAKELIEKNRGDRV